MNVSNLPAVQHVTGEVTVGNLPSTQDVRVTNPSVPVSGTVNVGNLPSTQQVQGTVNVENLPLGPTGRVLVSPLAEPEPQLFTLLDRVTVNRNSDPVVSSYVDVRRFGYFRWYVRIEGRAVGPNGFEVLATHSLDGAVADGPLFSSDRSESASFSGGYIKVGVSARYVQVTPLVGDPASVVVSVYLYGVPPTPSAAAAAPTR